VAKAGLQDDVAQEWKCGALAGERCKGLLDHTGRRGLPPMRSDQERRYAWQGWKRTVSAMLERKKK
jgi:hypothetical protein